MTFARPREKALGISEVERVRAQPRDPSVKRSAPPSPRRSGHRPAFARSASARSAEALAEAETGIRDPQCE
jgi:hypothetical protein